MVEKVVVYKVGDQMFGSAEEAAKHEAQTALHTLVESGPFVSADQGLAWIVGNAADIVAALSPAVPKVPVAKRGRRSKAQIEADKAAAEAAAAQVQEPTALAA